MRHHRKSLCTYVPPPHGEQHGQRSESHEEGTEVSDRTKSQEIGLEEPRAIVGKPNQDKIHRKGQCLGRLNFPKIKIAIFSLIIRVILLIKNQNKHKHLR